MKKLILPLLLALASSLPLSAAPYNVWSQTNSYSGTPTANFNLTFDQFNAVPAGWTVTSVVFTTTLNVSGLSMFVTNITVDKTDLISAYVLGADVDLTIAGSTSSFSAKTGTIHPAMSILPMQFYTVSAGPFASGYTNTYSGGQISQFVGSGTYNVQLDAYSANSVTVTGGGYTAEPSPGTTFGNVIANFFYAVPEPSTYAMIGSAALMLLALKRRGKDA